jgi:hypothetical protein
MLGSLILSKQTRKYYVALSKVLTTMVSNTVKIVISSAATVALLAAGSTLIGIRNRIVPTGDPTMLILLGLFLILGAAIPATVLGVAISDRVNK